MATDVAQQAPTPKTVGPGASPTGETIPPLQAGDRLTRGEFLRRYAAMPHINNAELIERVVYMPSPVSAQHGESHFRFNGLLFVYESKTPGVVGGDNSTLMLDLDNAPQPDGYLRLLPGCGGQADIVDGYVEGAPEHAKYVERLDQVQKNRK